MATAHVSAAELLAHHAAELSAYKDRVDLTVSPQDEMFTGNLDAYLMVGHSAMAVITAALVAAGKWDARTILDLPCGHGRVMRMLRARFPSARIVGCELDPDGADFCASQFSAEPVYSRVDPADIPIDDTFELIWAGSLLTHLDASLWGRFMDFFTSRLDEDGVLLFTVGGRYVALRPQAVPGSAEGFRREGFGYHESPGNPGYGVTYASPEWVMRFLAPYPQRVIGYWERGWNDHQDVVALSSRPMLAEWEPPRLV